MGNSKKLNTRDSQTALIRNMAHHIERLFSPDKIILFGSRSRGDASPESDVDILVVMPVIDSKSEQEIRIGVALHNYPIAKDIIVSTPEEYSWRKDIPGTVEYPAAHEGTVLYAKN